MRRRVEAFDGPSTSAPARKADITHRIALEARPLYKIQCWPINSANSVRLAVPAPDNSLERGRARRLLFLQSPILHLLHGR